MHFVNISYNIEKDLENYQYSLINKNLPKYGRENINVSQHLWPSFMKKLDSLSDNQDKKEFIKGFLITNYYSSNFVNISIESLEKYWKSIEARYLADLYSFMNVNDKKFVFNCYLTSLDICPYNIEEKYFYIPIFADIATQTKCMMHEIMHIVFLSNYKELLKERGLSNDSINDINESMTILLNWKFKKYIMSPEQNNKPSTFDLQKIISQMCRENAAFPETLDKLILTRLNSVDGN